MKGYTHQEIKIKLANGQTKPVMAWIKNIWAIHTEANNSKYFVVTHIPTGEGVFYFTDTALPGLTVAKSKSKAQRLVELLEDLDLTPDRPTTLELRQVAYRLEMVIFDISLEQAIANIDKKFGDIEKLTKTLATV